MRACRLIVHGRVQGVNFRHATRRVARGHGVAGWVRNRPDGTVEVHLEGAEAEVEELEEWVSGGGPPAARVTDVEAWEVDPEGLSDFSVRL